MNIAILLAGGTGTRMGNVDKPKQFIEVYGKPIIVHTLETFDSHPNIDHIGVVCLPEWMDDLRILLRKYEINKVKWLIEGGKTRQESIYNSLKEISESCTDEDVVIVHDSVRPLISHKIINENIDGAKKYGAVDTVIPSADTIIKSTNKKTIHEVPLRKELYIGQTPQSFLYEVIKEAHENAKINNIQNATDDCQLVLDIKKEVHLVSGEKLNFKITSFDDLLLFKAIIKLGKTEMI